MCVYVCMWVCVPQSERKGVKTTYGNCFFFFSSVQFWVHKIKLRLLDLGGKHFYSLRHTRLGEFLTAWQDDMGML